eukprot:3935407-Rhodomonas_salina.2
MFLLHLCSRECVWPQRSDKRHYADSILIFKFSIFDALQCASQPNRLGFCIERRLVRSQISVGGAPGVLRLAVRHGHAREHLRHHHRPLGTGPHPQLFHLNISSTQSSLITVVRGCRFLRQMLDADTSRIAPRSCSAC